MTVFPILLLSVSSAMYKKEICQRLVKELPHLNLEFN